MARVADQPLKWQAAYRIENRKSWSAPVGFPPPPPPASAPASQPAIDLPLPTTEVPVTPRKVEEASKALTPEPPAANKQPAEGAAKVPSTQPAGS